MTTAIFFALALCMAEIYSKGIKPNKNIWVLVLLAYIPISMAFSPNPNIDLIGINVIGFWSWQPFAKILIFGLLFITVSSHDFDQKQIITLLNVMVWCAFITAAYEITQMFFCDQFFARCADGDWGRIAGFIGNPTLTAPFCAMIVPLAFYLKKYWMAGVLVIGAIIPDSQMAWIALVAGICVYLALKGPKWFVSFCALSVILIAVYFLSFKVGLHSKNHYIQSLFQDHERFFQWRQIFKDWVGPLSAEKGIMNNYALTGRGIGSFRFVYHLVHSNLASFTGGVPENKFFQAHNDYLEFGYGTGYMGIAFLLMAIIFMVRISISIHAVFSIGEARYNRALISTFATVAVTAIGTFIFQIGTFAFYTPIICGLLHNESLNKESYL